MIRLLPPTHTVDGQAVLISQRDPAWDVDRVRAEREGRVAAALADKRAGLPEAEREAAVLTPAEMMAAIMRSPIERYFAGYTRFQVNASDWDVAGQPCTVLDFLKAGAKPTKFGLRRLKHRAYLEVKEYAPTVASRPATAMLVEAARMGLRSIIADEYRWTAVGDALAEDEQLEVIHAADPDLLEEIGRAVMQLCRPLDPALETPPCASSVTE